MFELATPMEAITVFLNEKYRPQSCCWFSLKVGTTIIGLTDICLIIINLIFGLGRIVVVEKGNSAVTFIGGESDVTSVILIMFRIIFLIAASAMLLGNFKGNKGLMLPYVYLKLGEMITIMILDMVMLPLIFFFLGKFSAGIIVVVVATVSIVVGIYCWQIVQCRILELEETARPETLFPHGDSEISAYGNVRDTSVQSAGITSSTDIGSQILH